MSRFTLRGSNKLDEIISKDLEFIVESLLSLPEKNHWDGIALIGSYGRGEGTPHIEGEKQYPYNDYNIVVVSDSLNQVQQHFMQKRLEELQKTFTLFVQIPVDLCLHTPESLKNAKPTLMNYELRYGHRILFGPKNSITKWMPKYTLKDIPLIEGTRLLTNRGTLLFFDKIRCENKDFLKYLLKTHLAMGDSLLLSLGKYHISYLEKRKIAEKLPQEYSWIKEHYLKAINFKEWGDPSPWESATPEQLLKETIDQFVPYFLSYEEKRLQRKLPDIPTYLRALEETVPPSLKNTLFNLLYFRQNALKPNTRWLPIPARTRLYPALLLLLTQEQSPLLRKLLPAQDPTTQFIQLQERFA